MDASCDPIRHVIPVVPTYHKMCAMLFYQESQQVGFRDVSDRRLANEHIAEVIRLLPTPTRTLLAATIAIKKLNGLEAFRSWLGESQFIESTPNYIFLLRIVGFYLRERTK